MFEQLDDQLNEPGETPRVSPATSIGIFVAYIFGAFGGLVLFIVLGDKPYGIQISTAITYTYFAFWYIFFPTQGMLERYKLRDKSVQKQIPLLLVIHCAFLVLLLLGQVEWLAMKPHLSSAWFTEYGKKRDTLYELVTIGLPILVFFAQVLISRGILSRSLANIRGATV